MSSDAGWTEFLCFDDRGAAEALCAALRSGGVSSMVEPRSLQLGVEAAYCVLVATDLAHRARWIVAQLPPTDAELNFLATGRLSDDT